MIEAFAVGVPARDEADRVTAAIEALARAARRSPVPVHLVLAADRCRDATPALARRALQCVGADTFASTGVRITGFGAAGGARHAACMSALLAATARGGAPERCWISTTDADSTVPPDWFEHQADWACRGADGIAGLVELATDDGLDPATHRWWQTVVEEAGTRHGHPHVHGANLGIRADLWLAVGGFTNCEVGEDRELWRRAGSQGARLIGTADCVVRTSARTIGRTPGGLARMLAEGAG